MLNKKDAELILKYIGAFADPDHYQLTEDEFNEAPKLLTKTGANHLDKYFLIMDIARNPTLSEEEKVQKVMEVLSGGSPDIGGSMILGNGSEKSNSQLWGTATEPNPTVPNKNKVGNSSTNKNKVGNSSILETKQTPTMVKENKANTNYGNDAQRKGLAVLQELATDKAVIKQIQNIIPGRTQKHRAKFYLILLGLLAEMGGEQSVYDFKKVVNERFGWQESTITNRIYEMKELGWVVEENDKYKINFGKVKDALEEAGIWERIEQKSKFGPGTFEGWDIILTGQDPRLIEAIKKHIDPMGPVFTFDFNQIDPTDENEVYLAETLREKPEAVIWAIHDIWNDIVEQIKDPRTREIARRSLKNLSFEIKGLWKDRTNVIDPDLDGKLITIEGFLEGAINQGSVVQTFLYGECIGTEDQPSCGYKTMFYLAPTPKTPDTAKCPICGGTMKIYTNQARTLLLLSQHPENKPSPREIEKLRNELEVIRAYVRLADDERDVLVVIPRAMWDELRHMPSYVRLVGILRYDRMGFMTKRDITPYVEVLSIEETTPQANITEEEFQAFVREKGFKDAMDYFLNRYLADYKSVHGNPEFTEAIKKLALAIASHLTWERGEDGVSYEVETIGTILIGPQGSGKSTIINKVVGLLGANLDPYVSPADSEKNLVVIENAISKDIHLPLKGKLPRNDLGIVVFEELDATIKSSEKLAIIKDALARGIVIRSIRGINYTFPARVSRVAIMNPPKDLERKFYETISKARNRASSFDSEDLAQLLADIIQRIGQSNVDRFPLIYLFPPMDPDATDTLLEALVSGQMDKDKLTDEEMEKARRFIQLIRYKDLPFNSQDTPEAWQVFAEQFRAIKPILRRFRVSDARFGKTAIAMVKAMAKLHHHEKVEPDDVMEAFGVIKHSFVFRFDEDTWKTFEKLKEKYLAGKVINDAIFIVLSEYQEKGITEPIDRKALIRKVQDYLKEKEGREYTQEEIAQHIDQMESEGILYEPVPGKVRLAKSVVVPQEGEEA